MPMSKTPAHPVLRTVARLETNSSGDHDVTVSRSLPLAAVGAGIAVLGLMQAATGGDSAIGRWIAVFLSGLVGAGAIGGYRRKVGKATELGHRMLGAYAALAIIVAGSVVVADSRVAAALIGTGIFGAGSAAALVAAVKGQPAVDDSNTESPRA